MLWDALVMALGIALVLLAHDDTAKHLGTALLSGFVIGGYAIRKPKDCKCDDPPPPPNDPNTTPEADMIKAPSGKYRIAEPSVALAIVGALVAVVKQLFGGKGV